MTLTLRQRLINAETDPDQVVDGFTMLELHEAFELVQNRENWKAPIDATVTAATKRERDVIGRAVTFFTGSVAQFELVGFNRFRVRAAGYYAAVGA